MKRFLLLALVLPLLICINSTAFALVWGVNPGASGSELINIDPITGTIDTSYSLSGKITDTDTEIGLAGYAGSLYYTNADLNNGVFYTIDPSSGVQTGSFSVSGGWEIDGLGYYADGSGNWLYTSGCSVNDVHRYIAADGSDPTFFWSNLGYPSAMAGDNGGRIFSYGNVPGGAWGLYEIDPLVNTNATFFASSPSESIVGMAFDGTYLYLSDTNDMLFTMNLSGETVNSLDLGYTLYALGSTEGTPNAVPEPATMILLGSGLLGLASASRKKFFKKK